MLNVLILPILTILLISGCSTTKSLEIFTKEVERMPLNLELPPVETLEQVNVIIVTSKNQEEVFAKMKEANIDPVVFGYSDEDWELVTKNNVRMRNQIVKLRAIIEAYKEYYEPEEQEGKSNMFKDFGTDKEFAPKTFNKDD
jgi:hypothetical protein